MVMVRWTWTGSPKPPPASSTIGSLQTVRMSTTTWIISESDSPASVTPLYQPSEPPREIGRLEAGERRHLRHDRVERHRRDDEVRAFDQLTEFFHEVSCSSDRQAPWLVPAIHVSSNPQRL